MLLIICLAGLAKRRRSCYGKRNVCWTGCIYTTHLIHWNSSLANCNRNALHWSSIWDMKCTWNKIGAHKKFSAQAEQRLTQYIRVEYSMCYLYTECFPQKLPQRFSRSILTAHAWISIRNSMSNRNSHLKLPYRNLLYIVCLI